MSPSVYIRYVDINIRVTTSAVGTLVVILALIVEPVLAQQPPSSPDAERISQQEFKTLVGAKAVVVVDTRDEDSYKSGHIPGALRLSAHELGTPSGAVEKTIARLKASKKPVVTYCACHGETTSLRVAALLRERGVADARALVGGWISWFNDGNPIDRGR
jgi:rhodanese-related sulfurtransferase